MLKNDTVMQIHHGRILQWQVGKSSQTYYTTGRQLTKKSMGERNFMRRDELLDVLQGDMMQFPNWYRFTKERPSVVMIYPNNAKGNKRPNEAQSQQYQHYPARLPRHRLHRLW